ncbi:MAG: hypothetical protein ACI4LS_12100, partial [Treponema sp.]
NGRSCFSNSAFLIYKNNTLSHKDKYNTILKNSIVGMMNIHEKTLVRDKFLRKLKKVFFHTFFSDNLETFELFFLM